MYKYLLAATALALVSSPAAARDGMPYVGIEGGAIFGGNAKFDFDAEFEDEFFELDDAITLDLDPGFDVDAIAGMDFGMFRAELELGHKKLEVQDVTFSGDFEDLDEDFDIGLDVLQPELLEAKGSATSIMANGLIDVFNRENNSIYVGGGVGYARVKFDGDKDNTFAWQLIAGARAAVSSNVDVGIKYRFFNADKLRWTETEDDVEFGSSAALRSHSVLVSLIYNFGAAAAPVVVAPAEPVVVDTAPPPPATQTCPDGSVILATAVCPPPPAPPAGERG